MDGPATDEEHEFQVVSKYVRLADVEMQRKIKSGLHVFQEAASACFTEASVETRVVSWLVSANNGAAKREKTNSYQAIEKVIRQVLA